MGTGDLTPEAADSGGGPNPPSGPDQGGVPDLIVRVGTAIVGGLGVVGLVTFVGAAILFMRFEAARLPTEEAIAVVPKSVLLAIGAEVVVPLTFALVLTFVVARALVMRVGQKVKFGEMEVRRSQVKQAVVGLAFVIPGVLIYYWVAIHKVTLGSQTRVGLAIPAVWVA